MLTRALMVQGTTSDAGKTTLVAGLCRALARRAIAVAPFKPQNMALNSAVTEDGGEIGRAQALQAQACNISASTDMNPVLLKPSSDTGAQVIVQGKVLNTMQAGEFHEYKTTAKRAVIESFQRLYSRYQFVVAEGAGSPAEINLREGDIANMGFAEAVDCPVILVADIDKGGVFAHLVGTLELLSKSEQARVIGFVINKFRGDMALLEPGLRWLENKTQRPVLGVIPYLHDLYLDSEDAIHTTQTYRAEHDKITIAVVVLPHTSNHTDFDALRAHPEINFQFVSISAPRPACDILILPGSKNVRGDLALLRQHQWYEKLQGHLRYGGKLIGICGGYQMLGEIIIDDIGIESKPGSSEGFGFIPMQTRLTPEKTLKNCELRLQLGSHQARVSAYEIHCGISEFHQETKRPFYIDRADGKNRYGGYLSEDKAILGCYYHGLFDTAEALDAICQWAGAPVSQTEDIHIRREKELERLADCVQASIDIDTLLSRLNADIA